MKIDIIGVPIDFGAGLEGARLGPECLRRLDLAGALAEGGHSVDDGGDMTVPLRSAAAEGHVACRFLEPIVSVGTALCRATHASVGAGRVPLVIGGDHSLALGSVRGAAYGRKLGLIWLDAHADFNTTDTTPSGNVHGMPLAALVGLGDARLVGVGGAGWPRRAIDPANVALLGVRDVDAGESELLLRAGVYVSPMTTIRRIGLRRALARAISVATNGTDGFYLSVDLDGFDPSSAPGVSTPVEGGFSVAEGLFVCHALWSTGKLVGMDLVELNPLTDIDERTAHLALALATAALSGRPARSRPRITPATHATGGPL